MQLVSRCWASRNVVSFVAAAAAVATGGVAQASQLFQAIEVDQARFVIVAVPIGSSGSKAQLQVYEQIDAKKRPCYEVAGGSPAAVMPLLGTFDFTGICRRYIDSQGYSARVGGEDLGSTYRFVVRKTPTDNLLVAAPAGGASGKPEMLVGRTQGTAVATTFLAFQLEPEWRVKRRAFGGRALGHIYLYRESWPADAAQTPESPPAGSLSQASVLPPLPADQPAKPAATTRQPQQR